MNRSVMIGEMLGACPEFSSSFPSFPSFPWLSRSFRAFCHVFSMVLAFLFDFGGSFSASEVASSSVFSASEVSWWGSWCSWALRCFRFAFVLGLLDSWDSWDVSPPCPAPTYSTYLNISQHISTYLNISQRISTYLNVSQHPNISIQYHSILHQHSTNIQPTADQSRSRIPTKKFSEHGRKEGKNRTLNKNLTRQFRAV